MVLEGRENNPKKAENINAVMGLTLATLAHRFYAIKKL
jgi:hypothetical protein